MSDRKSEPKASVGPLAGLRVVELAGLAPGPLAATVLADLGADVVRVDRPARADRSAQPAPPTDGVLGRGRRSVCIDLKQQQQIARLRELVRYADVLLEGFRPGVTERLGIGPQDCLASNPRLVYARLTGWGQTGPYADRVGHDIDYLAVAGALSPLGPPDGPPSPPANYVADFGGGGMLAVTGILAALWERERTGLGQVVDVAMTEGVGLFAGFLAGLRTPADSRTASTPAADSRTTGPPTVRPDRHPLDGSAPFYRCYACADGRYLAVGALEPRFYTALLTGLGLAEDESLPAQWEMDRWAELASRFAAIFRTRVRDHWTAVFEGTEACVAPVLELDEAPDHPQAVARGSYVAVGSERQPAPAPRFSRTPGGIPTPAPTPGSSRIEEVISDWRDRPAIA